MRKSRRKSAKVFQEKDATPIAEKVCASKKLVGGWWEERVDLTPCNGATPSESRIREIRTYGSMRGRRSKYLLLLYWLGLVFRRRKEKRQMNEQEYKDFLTYLFNEYIKRRINRVRIYFHPLEWRHEFDWVWRRLRSSMDVINFIKYHCDSDDDIYKTFKMERLKTTVDSIKDGVRWNRRIASEAGFLSAIEDHFAEILDGMAPEYFPPEELEILRELGSRDPQIELAGIIYLLKNRKTDLVSSTKEASASKQLDRVVERLSKEQERFKEETEAQNREISEGTGRRWFKALGQICQGAAFSIANVSLAIGLLPFPVSPETTTWGAMVSTTSGVGMILTGVGELRNE